MLTTDGDDVIKWGKRRKRGDAMTQAELEERCQEGAQHLFYCLAGWREKRKEVLRLDHYECQMCRERGKLTKAVIVHHVKHLDERPDLAMEIFDPQSGERQLVSLCRACHEEMHPERMRTERAESERPEERWD